MCRPCRPAVPPGRESPPSPPARSARSPGRPAGERPGSPRIPQPSQQGGSAGFASLPYWPRTIAACWHAGNAVLEQDSRKRLDDDFRIGPQFAERRCTTYLLVGVGQCLDQRPAPCSELPALIWPRAAASADGGVTPSLARALITAAAVSPCRWAQAATWRAT